MGDEDRTEKVRERASPAPVAAQAVPVAEAMPVDEVASTAGRTGERLGLIATALYLVSFAIYLFVCWDAVLALHPDGFATLLSGAFAPLAFLWLVLGFRQQGEELRHSAKALYLQGEELRKSAEQQAQLVGVTREQLDFERQQLEAEKQEVERNSQPSFALTSGGWRSAPDGSIVVSMSLLNRGATCTDVRLSANEGGTGVTRAPLLQTGQAVAFELTIERDQPPGILLLFLSFMDSRQRSRSTTVAIDVTRDAGGQLGVSLP